LPERVEPKLGAERFCCPHCGAYAHQTWYRLGMMSIDRGQCPQLCRYDEEMPNRAKTVEDDQERKRLLAFVERLKKNFVTYMYVAYAHTDWQFVNFHVSACYSCDAFTVWIEDNIVYPVSHSIVEPHEMMPMSVKIDFEEAGSIVNLSPRGAAALARLCIQKLVKELGETGDNLNHCIGELVKKGLEAEVQRALDVVRVIGNNAVHPGTIDLKDDKETALTLLGLVNMIVERRIAGPKKPPQPVRGPATWSAPPDREARRRLQARKYRTRERSKGWCWNRKLMSREMGSTRNECWRSHSTGNRRIKISSVISGACRPSNITTISGANTVRRSMRAT
jgi:Domain of unknown function (DUF4145)